MSKDVLVASPDDTIEKAATLMAQVNCGALPVGENDRLVDIITDRDITLRAVAKGNPPDRCTVREVMSASIKYVFDFVNTAAAAERMSQQQVRRLAVLNRHKHLVGGCLVGRPCRETERPGRDRASGNFKTERHRRVADL